jgi:outer membrane protein OmpA-like peptidoglycan-associated protein
MEAGMTRMRYAHLIMFTVTCIFASQSVHAQFAKEHNFFYFKGSMAVSMYLGELNSVNTNESFFGFGYKGSAGYVVTPGIAIGLDYRVADYPRTARPRLQNYTLSHTANLYAKYSFTPERPSSFYALGGAGMTFYGTYNNDPVFNPAFGLVAGLGLDVVLTDQLSLFFEGTMDFILDDEAMDMRRGNAGFDALGYIGAGLRVNLRPSFKPLTGVRINAPDTVRVAETVSMEAQYRGNPSGPVSTRWYFGDGNRADGPSALNVYRKAGTFTVTVVASDKRGEREARREIVVIEPPVRANIKEMWADGSVHVLFEPIRFRADVEGSEPIRYSWDFGDGVTTDERLPRHTYESEGTYTVTLRVDNTGIAGPGGVNERSITIDVHDPTPIEIDEPAAAGPSPEELALHTIYFAMGSVQLDEESRRLLLENVERLREYGDYCVQIDVFTDSVGNPQANLRLSEQRARAVERFYIGEGIETARISRTGLGEITEPCPPDDPGPGCREHRRAESHMVMCR